VTTHVSVEVVNPDVRAVVVAFTAALQVGHDQRDAEILIVGYPGEPDPPARNGHTDPHLEALTGYWNLIYELLDRAGVPPGTVEDLPRSAREAGLEVAGMNGCFLTADPEMVFGIHAATLAAARERPLSCGGRSGAASAVPAAAFLAVPAGGRGGRQDRRAA
jgi:hypothetical protein